MSADFKAVQCAFAAAFLFVITVALFTGHLTGWQFITGGGFTMSIYGAHNLLNDKFKDEV